MSNWRFRSDATFGRSNHRFRSVGRTERMFPFPRASESGLVYRRQAVELDQFRGTKGFSRNRLSIRGLVDSRRREREGYAISRPAAMRQPGSTPAFWFAFSLRGWVIFARRTRRGEKDRATEAGVPQLTRNFLYRSWGDRVCFAAPFTPATLIRWCGGSEGWEPVIFSVCGCASVRTGSCFWVEGIAIFKRTFYQ